MNISSIVVQALPKYVDELVDFFKEADYVDYHLHDREKGKIIVTVEGKGIEEEIQKLVKIQQLPHVIAADMMMTYQEEQLDEEIKKLEAEDPVPAILNETDVDVRDVVYNGDLKNKDLGF
jgi:nitrate reductase NapD